MTLTYKVKPNAKLKNVMTNEVVTVDILDEEDIEGRKFWIVRSKQRVLKLSKDAYSLVKGTK
jgi:hypothetical protein